MITWCGVWLFVFNKRRSKKWIWSLRRWRHLLFISHTEKMQHITPPGKIFIYQYMLYIFHHYVAFPTSIYWIKHNRHTLEILFSLTVLSLPPWRHAPTLPGLPVRLPSWLKNMYSLYGSRVWSKKWQPISGHHVTTLTWNKKKQHIKTRKTRQKPACREENLETFTFYAAFSFKMDRTNLSYWGERLQYYKQLNSQFWAVNLKKHTV